MSKTYTPPTVTTTADVDANMVLSFYVGPGGFPSDLRARLDVTHNDGSQRPIEIVVSGLTPSGWTAGQATAFLKQVRDACLTSGGYA